MITLWAIIVALIILIVIALLVANGREKKPEKHDDE